MATPPHRRVSSTVLGRPRHPHLPVTQPSTLVGTASNCTTGSLGFKPHSQSRVRRLVLPPNLYLVLLLIHLCSPSILIRWSTMWERNHFPTHQIPPITACLSCVGRGTRDPILIRWSFAEKVATNQIITHGTGNITTILWVGCLRWIFPNSRVQIPNSGCLVVRIILRCIQSRSICGFVWRAVRWRMPLSFGCSRLRIVFAQRPGQRSAAWCLSVLARTNTSYSFASSSPFA